jgi:hypothetical protein
VTEAKKPEAPFYRRHGRALLITIGGVITAAMATVFKEQVEALLRWLLAQFGSACSWLAEPSRLPNWLALLACLMLLGILIVGGITVAHWIAAKRGSSQALAWRLFTRGVFHSSYWGWRWSKTIDGHLEAYLLCPVDHTQMIQGPNEPGYSRVAHLQSGETWKCPRCRKVCTLPVDFTGRPIINLIRSEVDSGRWRAHHAEASKRRQSLADAVSPFNEWNGAWSIDETIERCERHLERH